MKKELNYKTLDQRRENSNFSKNMGLRMRRAISWIGCAENCDKDSFDERFIFLWLAFNAAYADKDKNQSQAEAKEGASKASKARKEYEAYFKKLTSLDKEPRIDIALREEINGPAKGIIKNRYTYSPFWKYHDRIPGNENWKEGFRKAKRDFQELIFKQNVEKSLSFVFDRLYVLRCQILHGGATWRGSVNRDQVEDGAAILEVLIPIFIDIMMDNPGEDWGKPLYPVVRT